MAPENNTAARSFGFIDLVSFDKSGALHMPHGQNFECDDANELYGMLARFTALLRRQEIAENDAPYARFAGVHGYAGIRVMESWLRENEARKVAFAVAADGHVGIVIKVEQPPSESGDKPSFVFAKTVNSVRLMALLTVALVDRAAQGADCDRSYPEGRADDTSLRIPTECVWPVAVERASKSKGQFTEAVSLLSARKTGQLRAVMPENWMVGYRSFPTTASGSTKLALPARFSHVTQGHLRFFGKHEEAPHPTNADNSDFLRKGMTHAFTMNALVREFKRTSLWLFVIWFAFALSTLKFGSQYNLVELWVVNLVFAVICIWRFIISLLLVNRTRAQRAERKRRSSRLSSRITMKLINVSFSGRYSLWFGPAFLTALVFYVFLDPGGQGLFQSGKPLGDFVTSLMEAPKGGKGASYHKAFVASIWAMPVLSIGLLRQTYLIVAELVAMRSQAQERLMALEALQRNWSARAPMEGTKAAEGAAERIKSNMEQMSARYKSELDRIGGHFGEKSATNAGLVAVIALMKPLAQMEGLEFPPRNEFAAAYAAYEETSMTGTDRCKFVNTLKDAPGIDDDPGPLGTDMLILHMLDCLESGAQSNKTALEKINKGLEARFQLEFAALMTGLDDLSRRFDKIACTFSTGQGCAAKPPFSNPAPSLEALAKQADALVKSLNEAEKTLDAIGTNRTFRVSGNLGDVYRDLGMLKQKLDVELSARSIAIEADNTGATDTIKEVSGELERLRELGNLPLTVVREQAPNPLAALKNELDGLRSKADIPLTLKLDGVEDSVEHARQAFGVLPRSHEVTLHANPNGIYEEVGRTKASVEALAKEIYDLLRALDQATDVNLKVTIDGGSGNSSLLTALGQCDLIGKIEFDTNMPPNARYDKNVAKWLMSKWLAWENGDIAKPAREVEWSAIKAALNASKDNDKTSIFVLGMADGQGPTWLNSDLAERRANVVAKFIAENLKKPVIPLPLGEAGWLTRQGLPGGEIDRAHRSAIVHACHPRAENLLLASEVTQ